jgi:hypothetical protein
MKDAAGAAGAVSLLAIHVSAALAAVTAVGDFLVGGGGGGGGPTEIGTATSVASSAAGEALSLSLAVVPPLPITASSELSWLASNFDALDDAGAYDTPSGSV